MMPRKVEPLFYTFDEMLRALRVNRETFLDKQPANFPKPNAFGNYSIASINEWAKGDTSTPARLKTTREALDQCRQRRISQ